MPVRTFLSSWLSRHRDLWVDKSVLGEHTVAILRVKGKWKQCVYPERLYLRACDTA